jgi:hypothetical protein
MNKVFRHAHSVRLAEFVYVRGVSELHGWHLNSRCFYSVIKKNIKSNNKYQSKQTNVFNDFAFIQIGLHLCSQKTNSQTLSPNGW